MISQAVDVATVRRMCQAIVHRGPDDEGIFVKDGVGLGMRRLSIIDLAGGHQPVFNEDRTVWVVFNGEIYNFPQLRRELIERGHRFYTHTDTEVIVHLYEDFGADCVKKLRGMFAFALYDERHRRLLMARDRLGKKPLHYAYAGGRLLFASEIKALLGVAPELAEINHPALVQYCYFGYIPDPATAFTAIHKLPPGHILELEDGRILIRPYWDLPAYGSHPPKSREECLEEMERRLEEAVRIRLIADVPLGAFLSGGTDSSTVVALMARASSRPVKTFSIGFRYRDFNEAHYARMVAEKFATEHQELILEPNVVETLDTLTASLEEPFGDSSMLPTYYVSCLARKYVTVALSGDGGDELFAGYERYRIHLHERSFRWIPAGLRRWYRSWLYRRLPRHWRGRNYAYSVSLPWDERYIEGITLKAYQREMGLMSEDFLASASGGDDPLKVFRDYLAKAPAGDQLSRVLYLDTKTYLPGDILTKVDRMSMATSLEVRAPLLDHEFVEWVAGLPAEWKMRGGEQKYLFRTLAERVGVPPEVIKRPKKGFALPLVHWMRTDLKELVCTVLLEPRTLQRGYFNPDAVRRLIADHFERGRDQSARLWRLLLLELWHRNFLERVGGSHFARQLDEAVASRGEL